MPLNNMASLNQEQERYIEAEGLYLKSVRITETVYGPYHASLIPILENIAYCYEKIGTTV